MNLATNCAKHILAEAKRAHVVQAEFMEKEKKILSSGALYPGAASTRCGRKEHEEHMVMKNRLEAIPPPPWSLGVLRGDLLPDMVEDDDMAPGVLENGQRTDIGALTDIQEEFSSQVQQMQQNTRKRKTLTMHEIISDVNALALQTTSQSSSQKESSSCGMRAGRSAFLLFRRDTRLCLPREANESAAAFNARALKRAQELWNESGDAAW